MTSAHTRESLTGSEVAIIGMAGRFPGARTLKAFWQNLCDGVESIQTLSDEALLASGLDAETVANPHFVKAAPMLDEIDRFDAAFFGLTPREAEMTDPQHRLFLECAWEALENAGYDPERYAGSIGVFAGTPTNHYWLFTLYSNAHLIKSSGGFQTTLGSDLDYLTTRISYKLNLRGPSVTLHTACSTSLVAVHLACQSILSGECDMALAGGVSVRLPHHSGYMYHDGGIVSPDGHCRAFDARGQGTIFGSGMGIVVLKRLADALEEGDTIQAVIKGSAINNDGALKIGFTAPGVDGQAEVIGEALAVAQINPETISYVEAHGTATPLGDPIEIEALTQAYRAHTQKVGYCPIGSVKTNVGHLDVVAGVTGLIKTVLALQHQCIPPSLHFEQPNPKIDFAASPFYVNTRLQAWKTNGLPRRAGVSSFGIGGTNAHAIVEEAPAVDPPDPSRPWQLLLLSARSSSALDASTANLLEHLKQTPTLNLADVAHTLHRGRRLFSHRRALVCRDVNDAVKTLEAASPGRVATRVHEPKDRPVVFMFPGQGAQYVGMGQELYQGERVFREQLDRCAELLGPALKLDIRQVLYPPSSTDAGTEAGPGQLDQTWLTQPVLFAVEYALAQLWRAWGVQPQAMIGHSLGEYVAACLAGVFSLEDALLLVTARGRMIQALPPGAMLSVFLSESDVRPLLDESLSLAAVNAPTQCVVSGPGRAVEALQQRLAETGVECRRLHTSHAFHSAMMDPLLVPFVEKVRGVTLNPPQIPYVSNTTGTWITDAQATDPEYWARHTRQAVRFAEGLHELGQDRDRILLEVGPGRTLSTLARMNSDRAHGPEALSSLRHPNEAESDTAFLLTTFGRLVLAGVPVDWDGFYAGERRSRIPLPTYPFERQRYWLDPQPQLLAFAAGPAKPGEPAAAAAEPALSLHPRVDGLTNYAAPGNEIERRLVVIWQELLGVAQVGIHDNFFELGGHSVLATQLASRLRTAFPVEIPVRRLFELPTVAQLAEAVAEQLIEKIDQLSDEEAQLLL